MEISDDTEPKELRQELQDLKTAQSASTQIKLLKAVPLKVPESQRIFHTCSSDGEGARMGDQERFANEIEGALHVKEQEKIIAQVLRVFVCIARFEEFATCLSLV